MSGSLSSSTPRELILDAIGGYVKEYSEVDSNPLDVDLDEPLPNQVRFYLFETSRSDEDHGWAINVRLENTDENGNEITDRESGSEWNPGGSYQVILGGYNDEYDVFTFWDDAVYSHYETGDDYDPHKSYVKDDTLARANKKGISIQPRKLRERGERGGETVITVSPDRIDEALQMRDRIEWIRTQLNEELVEEWAHDQLRAQRLEHLVYEFLANTDRRKSTEDRREQAFSRVHELQDVNVSTIKRSLRTDVYGDGDRTLPESLNDLLPRIERRYFESYNLWKEPVVFEDVDGTPDDIELYFPVDEDRSQTVIEQIDIALRSGNHVILTGPPGSGKSDLAEQMAEFYAHDYHMATATDDWTTFDTIGGYRPQNNGDLEFHPGLFLQRFMDKRRLGTRGIEAKNEWLVIDELNRANIDKAFGSLFSALTGNNVTLPFDDTTQEPTKPIKLNGNPNAITEPRVNSHTYYIPEDWRLIATINSVDKSSLYRMSRAFMRRFAFIQVPVPDAGELDDDGPALLDEYLDIWGFDYPDEEDIDNVSDRFEIRLKEDLAILWTAVQRQQKIGPGVIEDLAKHVIRGVEQTGELHYEFAVVAKLLPQLDGLPPSQMDDVLGEMSGRLDDGFFDRKVANAFTTEYLDIEISTNGD